MGDVTEIVMPRGFWNPLFTKIPKLQDLKITQILNSEVTCRVCRGTRLVAKSSDATNTYTLIKCLFCRGSGTMSTRENDYNKK